MAGFADIVLCAIADGLCSLTLNRPEKLNALNASSFQELDRHLDSVTTDKVGCVLISGVGRSFCAGHDLGAIAGGAEHQAVQRHENAVIERLASLPMPVVAAVQGHCFTGGLELALAADIIIAAEDAQFADTHGKWDMVPVWGLSQRLPRRVGMARAREMMFASRTYSGVEAVAMGLANFATPASELAAAAQAFCADVLANSWRATRAMKKLTLDTDGMTLHAGIAWEMHRSEGRGPEMQARIARGRKK